MQRPATTSLERLFMHSEIPMLSSPVLAALTLHAAMAVFGWHHG
jgi:hypothetical protein